MATFRSLIAGDLPPAGNPIVIRKSCLNEFPAYRASWVQSGTAALTLAMIAAREKASCPAGAKVILPAYACPDLVSAAEYAKLEPILVDSSTEFHGFDLNKLEQALTSSTVAVVAVNFLGVPEQLPEINLLLEQYPAATLIEDNAQWFPRSLDENNFDSEFVCLSFGRGKPVSLLGGGCLLTRDSTDLSQLLDGLDNFDIPANTGVTARLATTAKILLYNLLSKPIAYQLLNRNPFLSLGETRYKKLETIGRIDSHRYAMLASNIEKYQQRDSWQTCEIRKIIGSCQRYKFIDLATQLITEQPLLRYPLLCEDKSTRDKLLQKLNQAGLGASAMYRTTLLSIPGISDRVPTGGNFPVAQDFADRLLTLPTHQGVTKAALDKIRQIFHEPG